MIKVARTPDERFADLPDYPFEPHYAVVAADGVDPVRMHYLDEGPEDGPVALLLHGQPTWSYLYRTVVPVLVDRGIRVIAPDNIGFGRSDKPVRATDYTFARHIEWMRSLVTGLDLRDITLVAQDWGGPIGFSVLAAEPDRFASRGRRQHDPAHRRPGAGRPAHLGGPRRGGVAGRHRAGTARLPPLHPARARAAGERLRRRGDLDPAAGRGARGVRRTVPGRGHTAGLRQMIALLPLTRNDVGARIGRRTMRALEEFDRPFVTAYSDGDPATRGWETVFQERVPGARGQEHVTITGAGHFLQEDAGPRLAEVVGSLIGRA